MDFMESKVCPICNKEICCKNWGEYVYKLRKPGNAVYYYCSFSHFKLAKQNYVVQNSDRKPRCIQLINVQTGQKHLFESIKQASIFLEKTRAYLTYNLSKGKPTVTNIDGEVFQLKEGVKEDEM